MPLAQSSVHLTAASQGSWITAFATNAGGYTASAIPQVLQPLEFFFSNVLFFEGFLLDYMIPSDHD